MVATRDRSSSRHENVTTAVLMLGADQGKREPSSATRASSPGPRRDGRAPGGQLSLDPSAPESYLLPPGNARKVKRMASGKEPGWATARAGSANPMSAW